MADFVHVTILGAVKEKKKLLKETTEFDSDHELKLKDIYHC
jgi:hypothetical protein